MSLFPSDNKTSPDKPKKRPPRQRWTQRQKLRAAGRVGGAAVSAAGDVVRLVLKIVISAILVLITSGLLFACIFAYYVKNNLSTDLNITLSDYRISLSSTIWAYDKSGNPVELAVLQTEENRKWVD